MIVVQEMMNWEEALVHCRTHYTDLVRLTTEIDHFVVNNRSMEIQTPTFWTSLRFMDGSWYWVNQTSLVSNETSLPSCPARPFRCGARNIIDGVWENRDCEEKMNFICYHDICNIIPGKSSEPSSITLKSGMMAIPYILVLLALTDAATDCKDKYKACCYTWAPKMIVVQEMKNWEEALVHCRTHYTDLIRLPAEIDHVLVDNRSMEILTPTFWTSLRFMDGSWYWVNQTSLVSNETSLPSCPAKPFRCGARNIIDGVWENRDCEEKMNFICYHDIWRWQYTAGSQQRVAFVHSESSPS
ncbi:hypothetical protein KOW79_008640 [Hemibagrus wyckioides]|uniref:C-type lectin domain-containing protein n=1 Tax=Hemibagrus wyckioides TaxID=337641 RepID=A0A9D3NUA8_9TELE|nr:hypothetical protein KOW79_008640 [Hemibagrus wyckioides]